MNKIIKISTIIYLGIIINISETNANRFSNTEKRFEKKILKSFFKHNDTNNILLEIIKENTGPYTAPYIPYIQKMFQSFKKSFSQPHIHNTLVKVLTSLNENVIYPFYSTQKEVDYRDVGALASHPTRVLQFALSSALLSKFIANYHVKYRKEIESSEKELCQNKSKESTLFEYLTCDAKDKNKSAIFSDVLKIIVDSIGKKDVGTQKKIYAMLTSIAKKSTSLDADELAEIRLLLKQLLSTV
jgi:hypothetical protein